MRAHNLFIITLIFTLLTACWSSKEKSFSKTSALSDYPYTNFVPTLESKFEKGKNAIYCSTLLLAWDTFRKKINANIQVNEGDSDLFLFNQSSSFMYSLPAEAYKTKITYSFEKINIQVDYHVQLPFLDEFIALKAPLLFNGSKVESFGPRDNDQKVYVLYYKSDSDFVIKIPTKNPSHELILMNTDQVFETLSQAVQATDENIKRGLLDRGDYYRYNRSLVEGDQLIIPKIVFNIETNYPTLENKLVDVGGEEWTTHIIKQKTAFKLNEHGAEVESRAVVEMITSTIPYDYKPKKMVFNKPFFLLLRKKGSNFPYFALWIANTDLLRKE